MVTIIGRSQWGANPAATPAGHIAIPTPELWLHHTASSGLHGASGMRSLQQGAKNGGYVDLEYSYVVDTDGAIYESRGIGRDTAATGGNHNAISHAVCAMGNFENDTPTQALITSLADICAWLYQHGATQRNAYTGPHRDASGNATACCGHRLIAEIGNINQRAAGGSGTQTPAQKGGAVHICTTPSGRGYYVAASDGGVFAYGDAKFHGSMGDQKLNAPVVAMAVRPQNDGYILVGADGGVFCFGKAAFLGGMGGKHLNAPVVGCDYNEAGDGYYLLAQDGGVFAYGKANFYGAPTGKVN